MKTIKLLLSIIFIFTISFSFGQTTGILYTASSWNDSKGNGGDFVKASDNPKNEKVEILQTSKYFKVTLGQKVTPYMIKSSKIFSVVMTSYNVVSNNVEYILSVSDNSKSGMKYKSTFYITLKDKTNNSIWFIPQIDSFKTIDVK